ncbi:hypothetical protein NLG97_g2578 [Lecanicillium saksenae]|uniref:Uncharacterized protein n=1 Tax=Lecanicillium saksenae TaxID=468837 RepID=A0ACC1R165_9HYPO|nr:hypothetical protein NLG97_g2578 [Lecanicillium saksenae]
MLSPLDSQFGPQLAGQFDFTLLFEHVMFTIVPGVVAILAIPFYLNIALRQIRKVRPGILLWLKLVVGLALLATHIASLALWQQASLRSEIATTAAVISLVTSLCILVVLYIAHIYSLQPSALLSIFLTITALLDITKTRSYFRRDDMEAIGSLQISITILKFVLIIFEELSKRSLFYAEQLRSRVAKETASGFWNRYVFGWLNSLLLFGYKNDLTIDNLPNLDEDFNSMKLYDQFTPKWNRVNKTSTLGLLVALVWTTPWQAFKIIIPRLVFVGLLFSQPFLLFRIVSAVQKGERDEEAHALIGATAFIFIGIAISRVLYEHASYRLLTSVRGTLIVAIYDKMHRLPKEKLDELASITLMTTDVPAVEDMMRLQYEIWSSTILVGLGLWSLYLFVGPACFLMLTPGIYSFFASRCLGKFLVVARRAWNEEMESRVAATSNILAQIKGIKSMGLSNAILEFIQEKRQKEVEVSLRDRRTRIWVIGSSSLTSVLSPILVLAGAIFWTRVTNPLGVADIFTVLAIVNIASSPFITLLHSAAQWSAGFASLQRIREFLVLEDHEDPRISLSASAAPVAPSAGSEKTTVDPSRSEKMPFAVHFDLVTVTSKIVGPILKEVNLRIPWGALAMLRGPVNSGKSTFLKCIIGETMADSGVVRVGTKSIAYCSQGSWIQNQTVRNNITGVLDFIEAWYREVLAGCALDVDILAWTNGDLFMTGTGGCNLSGGQKQRVGLARAVYARAEIMVVDDVLSALDPETARSVFANLFGKDGLVHRWNCTVIMTTNQDQLLDNANIIFRLHKGGKVEEQEPDLSNEASLAGSVTEEQQPDHGNSECSDAAPNEPNTTETEVQDTQLPYVKPTTENLELLSAGEGRKYGDWSLYGYFFASTKLSWLISSLCLIAVATTVELMPKIFVRIWYSTNANSRHYLIQLVPRSSEELHLRIAKTAILFSQDMSLTSRNLPVAFLQFAFAVFTILIEVAVIAAGSSYASPIIVLILLLLYGIQFFYLRTSLQLRLLELESTSNLITLFTETSAGIHHIRSFQWQQQFMDRLYYALSKSQKPVYVMFCCQRWLTVVLDLTVAVASIILVAISVDVPVGGVSGAGVGLALLALISFSENASHLIQIWTAFEISLGAISRIRTFCSETPLEKDAIAEPDVTPNWPNAGYLEFNCVSARAEDGTSQKALNDVSLTIRPGDKVGISRRTGSGKSSIFMTILRMVEFTGTITIDGRILTTVPREHLRSRITTFTQDGLELQGSLRFNLYPFAGSSPDDELIESVLQSLGLWEHIQSHGGFDGDIIDMGFSVSQKQKLSLARGILHQKTHDTRTILVDEATSAMDGEANAELQRVLEEVFADCTVLQIAHREDSFRAATLLVKLEAGQLVSAVRV